MAYVQIPMTGYLDFLAGGVSLLRLKSIQSRPHSGESNSLIFADSIHLIAYIFSSDPPPCAGCWRGSSRKPKHFTLIWRVDTIGAAILL